MSKLYFNTRDELNRIDVSKIVYFEADGNYTTVVMVNKLRAAICMNLGEMEKALTEQLGPEDRTFRINSFTTTCDFYAWLLAVIVNVPQINLVHK